MENINAGVIIAYIIIGVYCAAVFVIGMIPLIWMINHPQKFLAYMGYV